MTHHQDRLTRLGLPGVQKPTNPFIYLFLFFVGGVCDSVCVCVCVCACGCVYVNIYVCVCV